MTASSAVDWWEEWQLRMLVIGSQSVQWLLFFSAPRRKSGISASFRVLIWLAYLGSDAVAIYALAALFYRQRKHRANPDFPQGNDIVLEVVWAPVLLMHLGGQDCITAYNMEDNELWRRHALTAVSQITVSIYVFCKTWRGGDKKLLQAAIMLFTLGIIRCLEKPFALKHASINSLVSSSDTTARTQNRRSTCSVEDYVKKVLALYQAADRSTNAQGQGDAEPNHISGRQAQDESDAQANHLSHQAVAPGEGDPETNPLSDQAQGQGDIKANHVPADQAQLRGDVEANPLSDQAQGQADNKANHVPADQAQVVQGHVESNRLPEQAQGQGNAPNVGEDHVNKLFVDLASPYHDRIYVTKSFLALDGNKAYARLEGRLSDTFDLLYTKAKMVFPDIHLHTLLWVLLFWFRLACSILPFAAIALFHKSHREAYNDKDVKVTYALFCCTAAMELLSFWRDLESGLSGMVSQYSFVGFFARNEKYSTRMFILSSLRCKDYADQLWCMEPKNSSSRITGLVHRHVKDWWKQHIRNAALYTRFNNHRGQWTIEQAGCGQGLGWSTKRPFDESVLLWHIATDLCFYRKMGARSEHYTHATRCREVSNYMMYLLFAKPDMLLAGTRRNLFIAAYDQLKTILHREGGLQQLEERAIVQRLIAKVEESPQGGFVDDAWVLAKALLALDDDEKKMWDLIEGVWVEMLCFSASRCRGYLHAQSLGTGGELLTFVWLLWSHMGMETLAEKMQLTGMELPSDGEQHAGAVGGGLVMGSGVDAFQEINHD